MTVRTVKHTETRTIRTLTVEEIEQALSERFGFTKQHDVDFDWDVGEYLRGVDIIHTERKTEEA